MKSTKTMPQLWIIVVAILLVVLAVSVARAEGITILPNLGESSWITMYDCEAHGLKTGLRYPALGYKFLYADGQVITDMDTTAFALGLGLELVEFARWVGLKVFLSQNFHLGFNGGYNFKLKKSVWGPWAGIKVKF